MGLSSQKQQLDLENKNLRQMTREIGQQQKRLESSQEEGNRLLSSKLSRQLVAVKMKKNYQE